MRHPPSPPFRQLADAHVYTHARRTTAPHARLGLPPSSISPSASAIVRDAFGGGTRPSRFPPSTLSRPDVYPHCAMSRRSGPTRHPWLCCRVVYCCLLASHHYLMTTLLSAIPPPPGSCRAFRREYDRCRPHRLVASGEARSTRCRGPPAFSLLLRTTRSTRAYVQLACEWSGSTRAITRWVRPLRTPRKRAWSCRTTESQDCASLKQHPPYGGDLSSAVPTWRLLCFNFVPLISTWHHPVRVQYKGESRGCAYGTVM